MTATKSAPATDAADAEVEDAPEAPTQETIDEPGDDRIDKLESQLGETQAALGDIKDLMAQLVAQAQAAPPPPPAPPREEFDEGFYGRPSPGSQPPPQFHQAYVEPREPKKMTIKELRAYDGQLYIRHNDGQRQFSCHQQLGEHRVDFDLGPKDSESSICHFPKLALEIRGIQRAIMRGVITVSTDESMEDEIMLMMGRHLAASEDQINALLSPLEPSNVETDIITKPCLACGHYTPDPITGDLSMVIQGGQAFQPYSDWRAGVPPLCDNHSNQRHQWVGQYHEDPDTGIGDWVFTPLGHGQAQQSNLRAQGQGGPIRPAAQQQMGSYR